MSDIDRSPPELSVIIPVHNEADNISPLLARLGLALSRCVSSYEVVFIDDGSRDDTLARLRSAHGNNPNVHVLSFSRNFGKEIAIAAGIDHARGQAAVIMDADLQHPPETIAEFVAKWREGYSNVYGQRIDRAADTPMRRYLTGHFYRIFGSLAETALPPGAGDFRLIDRKALEVLKQMRERARFNKGLFAWIGFKSIGVPFHVADRMSGDSKFSYRKLTRFALDGLMSFSTVPLMVWTFIGFIVSIIAISMAIYYFIRTMITGNDVPGYASLIVSVMFLSGVQLLSLGVIGEYIGRIFAEVKGRPLYVIAEDLRPDADTENISR